MRTKPSVALGLFLYTKRIFIEKFSGATRACSLCFIVHSGVALLWVPALGGAPARAPGGCVFEERVGVGD
jgi:hypothetical protein